MTNNDGGAVNNGTGSVSKTTLAAPDFGSLFDDLDLCAVIDQHAGLLLDGLDRLAEGHLAAGDHGAWSEKAGRAKA